jgi:hypothetical protein
MKSGHYVGTVIYFIYLCMYGLINDAVSSSDNIVSSGRMISELERMWKEVVMA